MKAKRIINVLDPEPKYPQPNATPEEWDILEDEMREWEHRNKSNKNKGGK
jgi:hypothetical protein